MRKAYLFSLIVIIATFIIGVWLYPTLPDELASHWNAAGEIDGYLPKFWGLFMMPLITLGIFALLAAIPTIDPLKKNLEKSRKYYDGLIVLMVLFMSYIHAIIIVNSMGLILPIFSMLIPAFTILFYFIGMMMKNLKRNWFVGVKTPWTLSSDKIWEKTHKKGATLFKLCGIIALAGLVVPDFAIWIMVAPIIIASVYLVVYSYYLFQKG